MTFYWKHEFHSFITIGCTCDSLHISLEVTCPCSIGAFIESNNEMMEFGLVGDVVSIIWTFNFAQNFSNSFNLWSLKYSHALSNAMYASRIMNKTIVLWSFRIVTFFKVDATIFIIVFAWVQMVHLKILWVLKEKFIAFELGGWIVSMGRTHIKTFRVFLCWYLQLLLSSHIQNVIWNYSKCYTMSKPKWSFTYNDNRNTRATLPHNKMQKLTLYTKPHKNLHTCSWECVEI